jgi:hypothetical protein
MPSISIVDLANAKLDVDHIAEIATSPAATATDRLGHTKPTIQGAADSITAKVAAVEAAKATALAVSIPAAVALVNTAVAATAAGTAVAARVAAEVARDAALAGASIYDTIALGRAAVVDGAYFKVRPGGADALTRVTLYKRLAAASQEKITTLLGGAADENSLIATTELTYANSRFYELSLAVVDAATGQVISGLTDSGAEVGRNATSVAALVKIAEDQVWLNPRFYDLTTAVIDDVSGVVLLALKPDGSSTGVALDAAAVNVGTPGPPASLIHLGGLGQSLMDGALGAPVLSTVQPFGNVMFSTVRSPAVLTAFNPLVEATQETVMSALTAQYNSRRANAQPMLATVHAVNGQPIVEFIKGTAPYLALMAAIAAAKSLSDAQGRTYFYAGTLLIQGERDEEVGTTYPAYLAIIKKLAWDLDADIRALTGQSAVVPLLISQVSSHSKYGVAPRIPLAQYQAAKDLPGLCVLIGPKYHLPYSDGLHLTNHGYRSHGSLCGKVFEQIYLTTRPWKPLMPLSVLKQGSKSIMLKFNPQYKLEFNTVDVTDPNGQKGFEFVDDTGTAGLTTVELVGDDLVHLVVSRAIGLNPKVRYAYTAVNGANAGPTTGARGCLRDADPTATYYKDAGGNSYPMFNYAPHFEEGVQ